MTQKKLIGFVFAKVVLLAGIALAVGYSVVG